MYVSQVRKLENSGDAELPFQVGRQVDRQVRSTGQEGEVAGEEERECQMMTVHDDFLLSLRLQSLEKKTQE